MTTEQTEQTARTAPPAFIVPSCFEGDDIPPASDPESKVVAIGNVLLKGEEDNPALRPLAQAWLDIARYHPDEMRQLADDIDHNLKAAAQQEQGNVEQLVDAAERAAMRAVTASLAGLLTNPTDVSKLLHRAIDNAQGWHLAEAGDHSEVQAYSSSRFSTAVDAMADALAASENPTLTAEGLRAALDLVIREARQ